MLSRGKLRDFILDWEDALPEAELQKSEAECSTANLVLCLGTSLQITPVCNLPLRCTRAGGAMAIVNLQRTPKHRSASLALHARCDGVMAGVMRRLQLAIEAYVRRDQICVYVLARTDPECSHVRTLFNSSALGPCVCVAMKRQ
jgi:mono-ADP-ribosyltransferase sirtuin 6